VCIDVYPVKRRRDNKDMVRFRWAIYFVNGVAVRRDDGSFFYVAKDYTPSMRQNAWLRKDLERLRGKPYDEAQVQARVDVEKVIGVTAELLLVPGFDPARFTNIDTILPAPAGYTLPIPEGYQRMQPDDPSRRGGRHTGPGLQQPPPPVQKQPATGYPPQPAQSYGGPQVPPSTAPVYQPTAGVQQGPPPAVPFDPDDDVPF
jgi:hypothetical protein